MGHNFPVPSAHVHTLGTEAHSSAGKCLMTPGDTCLAASFASFHVKKRHPHGKDPMFYEWRPYNIITSPVLFLKTYRNHGAEFQGKVSHGAAERGCCKGRVGCGEALQAGWFGSTFVALCQGQQARCCLWKRGWEFSERFRRQLTAPYGSLAE